MSFIATLARLSQDNGFGELCFLTSYDSIVAGSFFIESDPYISSNMQDTQGY